VLSKGYSYLVQNNKVTIDEDELTDGINHLKDKYSVSDDTLDKYVDKKRNKTSS
jgi:hypothetical protein